MGASLNGRVRLARLARVRLLEKKRLFCSTAKDVMRKLSFVKVAMY